MRLGGAGSRRTRRCSESSSSAPSTGRTSPSLSPVVDSTICSSSARVGYPTLSSNMKRSSCASGSGYVPSCSIGFCVASTKNGFGNSYVRPATVTLRSCIACSSAACVFGGARLISSASTMFANTGPGAKRNARLPVPGSSSINSVPVMSLGIRSGVNCTRENVRSRARETVCTSSVFASPGTPTSTT